MSRVAGIGFPGTDDGTAGDLPLSFSMSLSRKYTDSEAFTTSPFKNGSLIPRLPIPV